MSAPSARGSILSLASFIPPERVAIAFGCGVILLVVLHLSLQAISHWAGGMDQLVLDRFNVDVEGSFPTWYSSALLLVAGLLLAAIAWDHRGARFSGHWWGLASIFFLLSAEEIAGIHELVNERLPWTIPGVILVVLLGLLFFRFLSELPSRTRRLFVLSGAVYVAGALGLEQATAWDADAYDLTSFRYAVWAATEEGFEMMGVVLFVYALLDFIRAGGLADPLAPPGPTPIE
ncbi:MAG: hypothetical protein ACT4PM_12050 [Gemmatimonadales bacterium]